MSGSSVVTAAYHNRRGGAKSFVDDLVLCQGVVLSRADVLLRSIETKSRDSQICSLRTIAGQVAGRRVLLPENGRLRLFWGSSVCQLAKQPANLRRPVGASPWLSPVVVTVEAVRLVLLRWPTRRRFRPVFESGDYNPPRPKATPALLSCSQP